MSTPDPASATGPVGDAALGHRVLAKVTRRLIPFLFLLYIAAYLDRINLGFAQLQMKDDARLAEDLRRPDTFGTGGGIFFLGYFLFEIPGNLILERTGARRWIAGITVAWGVVSAAMMFVTNPFNFYLLRFLLGLAQAGFFPGMILYLTYWFPERQRARAVARFMTASAVAGILSGLVSGSLLRMDGLGGLAGWQWLFLVEGLPSVILGVFVLLYLTDRPDRAHWLSAAEREWVVGRLREEEEVRAGFHGASLGRAFRNRRVWLLTVPYFASAVCFYGFNLWLPTIIKEQSGWTDDWAVGLATAVPYLAAIATMVLVGAHSDRSGERQWHVAIPAALAAGGFVAAAAVIHTGLAFPWLVAALVVAAAGMWSVLGPFWGLPTSFLSGTAAAGGIALINSIGNLGGYVGPRVLGRVREEWNSFAAGLLVLALAMGLVGALVLCLRPDPDPGHPPTKS